MSEMVWEYGDVTDGYGGMVPVDGVVSDVLGDVDPVNTMVDDTIEWVESDPSLGWVGDYPATDPVHGDLAPVLGETGDFGSILHGVLDDPNAPLSPEDETFLQEQLERDTYYNTVYGGIQDGIDMQDRALDDIREFYEDEARHNLESDTHELMNDIAGTIGTYPDLNGWTVTYPVMPWPSY